MYFKKFLLLLIFVMLKKVNYSQDSIKIQKNYYYFAYSYGNQSIYNPLTVILNRGWDVVQCQLNRRQIFKIDYYPAAKNVLENWKNPIENISQTGWKTFLSQEIFPLDFSKHGARWAPNYSLHLLGGGVSYKMLSEWFDYQEVPLPRVNSAIVILFCAFVNETLENKNLGKNTDAIADFYFFDIPAIFLFNIKKVNYFLTKYFHLADWSTMPSFVFPSGELHNNGQYFAAKLKIPFTKNLYLFNYFGLSYLGGFSYEFSDNTAISVAAGAKTSRLVSLKNDFRQNTLDLGFSAGIFYDKNNSLLASFVISDVEDYFCQLSIFPSLVSFRGFSPGFWVVLNRKIEFSVGVSAKFPLGIGVGIK